MGDFADQKVAARMRDLITHVASNVVERMRPEEKLAKVFDIDPVTNQASVLFAGEVYPDLTTVRCPINLVPTRKMIDSYDTLGANAPGDIVRVGGAPGKYYIIGFYSGRPTAFVHEANSGNVQPFDGQMIRDSVTGQIMAWRDSNASWDTLSNVTYTPPDTGWVTHAGGAGDATYFSGTAYTYFEYRQLGNQVFVRGQKVSSAAFSPTNADFANMAVHNTALPVGIRPTRTEVYLGRWDDCPVTLILTTAGVFTIVGGTQRTYASGTTLQWSACYSI